MNDRWLSLPVSLGEDGHPGGVEGLGGGTERLVGLPLAGRGLDLPHGQPATADELLDQLDVLGQRDQRRRRVEGQLAAVERVEGRIGEDEQAEPGADPVLAMAHGGGELAGRHGAVFEVDHGGEGLGLVHDVQSVGALGVLGDHGQDGVGLVGVVPNDARHAGSAGCLGGCPPAVARDDVVHAGPIGGEHDERVLDAAVLDRPGERLQVAQAAPDVAGVGCELVDGDLDHGFDGVGHGCSPSSEWSGGASRPSARSTVLGQPCGSSAGGVRLVCPLTPTSSHLPSLDAIRAKWAGW